MNAPAQNLIFNQVKAGLSSVSPSDISRKIVEASKNTKYYRKQTERSKSIDDQIADLRYKLSNAKRSELLTADVQVNSFLASLEKKRNMNNIFLHADLDAFFASVEVLDDPSLKGIPFVVGGSIQHGVVSTSSYEARKFGVRSGMAIFIALSLCPDIRIVKAHGYRYVEMSKLVMDVFEQYDPNYSSAGLDEASLNITDYVHKSGLSPYEIAKKIQEEVFQKTKLTVSIGIASTHQLSKIASDINKPNGIFQVPNDRDSMIQFIRNLPVRKIPGVGGVTERKLQELKFETMADILDRKNEVWFLFSKSFCTFIFSSAIGVPYSRHVSEQVQSISKEQTFNPTNNLVELIEKIEVISEKLALKLQRNGLGCKTVTVKFKSSDFQLLTRCYTFDQYVSNFSDISNAAIKILMDEHRTSHLTLRLIGVRLSNFIYPGQPRQKTIKEWTITNKKAPFYVPPNEINNDSPETEENIEIKNETKQKYLKIETYFDESEKNAKFYH